MEDWAEVTAYGTLRWDLAGCAGVTLCGQEDTTRAGRLPLEQRCQQQAEFGRIMAGADAGAEDVGGDDLAFALPGLQVDFNGTGVLAAIALKHFRGRDRRIADDEIQPGSQMRFDQGEKIRGLKAMRFAQFRHQAADEHLLGSRLADRLRHTWHQEIRDNAGIEITGSEDDEIGGGDGQQHPWDRGTVLGFQPDLFDVEVWVILRRVDVVLTVYDGSIFQTRTELNARLGDWQDHFSHMQQVA